jgi:hypothetical protein
MYGFHSTLSEHCPQCTPLVSPCEATDAWRAEWSSQGPLGREPRPRSKQETTWLQRRHVNVPARSYAALQSSVRVSHKVVSMETTTRRLLSL